MRRNSRWIIVGYAAGVVCLTVSVRSASWNESNLVRPDSQSPVSARTSNQRQASEWAINTEYGVTVRVAQNTTSGSAARTIYLLVEPQDFTEENLKKVFVGFGQKYNEPPHLVIHCMSDVTILEKALLRDNSTAVFLRSEQSQTGYYRAVYYRYDGEEETMTYSPDKDKPDMVTVVLRKKVIRYTSDNSKNLLLAIEEGDSERARSLLKTSPNMHLVDEEGDNPLMVAILSKSELAAEVLDRTDEIDHRNGEGWTALMYAAADGNIKIVTTLLMRGAEVDAKNQYGYTPLMLAATRGNPEVVKLLLSKGADVNAREEKGRTALVLIKGSLAGAEQEDMARLLKNAGGRE